MTKEGNIGLFCGTRRGRRGKALPAIRAARVEMILGEGHLLLEVPLPPPGYAPRIACQAGQFLDLDTLFAGPDEKSGITTLPGAAPAKLSQ